jgi:NuA3 HAT complex component NTO1
MLPIKLTFHDLTLTITSRLDSKHVFREGLQSIRTKLNSRSYTSVALFSADLANVLSSDLGVEAANTAELQQQVSGRAMDMTFEQRERRKLAKRIVKAVQPALEEALRHEGELSGRPFEKQIRELDMMLDNSTLSRRESFSGSTNEDELEIQRLLKVPNARHTPLPIMTHGNGVDQDGNNGITSFTFAGTKRANSHEVEMIDVPNEPDDEPDGSIAQLNGELSADTEQTIAANTPPASTNGVKGDGNHSQNNLPDNSRAIAPEPPTPPLSLEGMQQSVLVSGGIPWYVEPFDPDGTTLHEERWTGPEVLREMSEELTDIDDEELLGLAGEDYDAGKQELTATTPSLTPPTRNRTMKKNGKARKRWRGFRK